MKTSGALFAGGAFSRFVSGEQESTVRKNWAGNYQYRASQLHLPKSVAEVQEVVKSCSHLRALGTRHSFNGIADSTANQVSLKSLDQMSLDKNARTVTVGAGVTYGQLSPYLYQNGFALHNLASLPHISVAGACATATHGSGNKNGNLATPVSAMEIVTASGEVVTLSRERDGERVHGAVVGLGGLGVVTKLTLDVQPAFDMKQVVYENLSFTHLKRHLDEIFASGYSVSLFTVGKTIKRLRYGSRAAPIQNSDPNFLGRSSQPRNFIRLPGTQRKIVPNRWAFPVPGMSDCRISA